MNREDAKKRIDELKSEIEKFNKAYYSESSPLIPDYQYDLLYRQLKGLETEYPEFITEDSPTQRVNEDVIKGFEKTEHNPKMYSLDNTYSDTEMISFIERIEKQTDSQCSFVVQPKIDGVAVSVIYRNGKLYKGISRGNGLIGDDITENIKTVNCLPHLLKRDMGIDELTVRGEVFFTKERFEELSSIFDFANARNAASGTLKLLDSMKVMERGLSMRIHTVITPLSPTDEETTAMLMSAGLPIVEKTELVKSAELILEVKNIWEKQRHELPYETDGIVIKVNELALRKKIGYTNKSPKWAFAFKYKPENAVTKLISIDMQVGRTGIITPVANLTPVHLSGTTVKRATLHNFDEIERLGICINDEVEIEKSGEIIPKIIRVAKQADTDIRKKIEKPLNCPSCGERTVSFEDEVALRCINVNCPAQIERSLIHFVSKAGMDIGSMGPALIHQLIEKGKISSISDIYQLKTNDIMMLERMGEKSADNIINAIEQSKKTELASLINALGIRNVGEYLSKILAERYRSIDLLMNASREDLLAINGIGDEVAQSLEMFFGSQRNKREIEKLLDRGLIAEVSEKTRLLDSKRFVVTGKLNHFTRDSIKRSITDNGGIVHSSITRNTDYLIVGENPGSKLNKAKEKGVEVISENEFINMLENQ